MSTSIRWAGLTAADSSQATAIAAVMKQFTDEGIEVWLRFGHEGIYHRNFISEEWVLTMNSVNYYQVFPLCLVPDCRATLIKTCKFKTDGTYTASELITCGILTL